jgi:hypothetical protein
MGRPGNLPAQAKTSRACKGSTEADPSSIKWSQAIGKHHTSVRLRFGVFFVLLGFFFVLIGDGEERVVVGQV